MSPYNEIFDIFDKTMCFFNKKDAERMREGERERGGERESEREREKER